MKISEIFLSINGEGQKAGLPTVFVRTFGCNLRCSYCDSMYAVEGSDSIEMSVAEIKEAISRYFCNRVTFTGGEPLLQKGANSLVYELLESGYEVEIETNGAVDLKYLIQGYEFIDPSGDLDLSITMDWKCPSSGQREKMIESNLSILRSCDTLKFVVGSKEDLQELVNMYKRTKAQVYVSPVFGQIEPKEIVEFLLDNKMDNVRMQLQLHKFIWPVDMRGV